MKITDAGLSNYLNKARGISFELLKKVEEKAIKEGILKKGGYMNFTEEIKKEAKQEGRKAKRKVGRKAKRKGPKGRLANRPKGSHFKNGRLAERIKKLKNGAGTIG